MRKLFVIAAAAALLAACNQQSASEMAQAASEAEAAKTAEQTAAQKAYMDQNAKVKGVVTLPSGVQYRVVREGPPGGAKPGPEDRVAVMYEGKLVDGTVFDSSYERKEPAVFGVNQVIPGWAEAVQQMKIGDEFEVVIPSALGYGPEGTPSIPPNSVLIFKLELLDVAKKTALG